MGQHATPVPPALARCPRARWLAALRCVCVLLAGAAASCASDAAPDNAGSMPSWQAAPPPAAAGAGAIVAAAATGTPMGTTAAAGAAVPAGQAAPTSAAGAMAIAMSPAAALPVAGAGAAAAAGTGAAAPSAAAGHGQATENAVGMTHAEMSCLLTTSVDPRDEMLTDEPLVWEGATGGKDLLVPQLVLDWMGENEFESAHDGWHLVRKWDQSCLQSNASATTCLAAQRLQSQGLERAPVQQGAAGDGLAFMAMHRHMIHMLKETFPKHAKLFEGFNKVPRTTEDPENPASWHRISWTADNIKGFDILENIEQHMDMFPTEDDLGNYIENTYRWTPETPMSPTNQPGSGLHGALHSQWAVSGSPGNLIEQSVDVRNFSFWKLHGWIDKVWQRYRVAKKLKDDDADYTKIMHEQCMEMYYLKKSNRDLPKQPTGTTSASGSGAAGAESGFFATQVRPFLDSTCGGCHSAIGPSAGLTLGGTGISSAEVMQGLVGRKATNGEYSLIEPGDPQHSWVYLKASGDSGTVMCTSACGRQKMPPSGDGLSAAQLQLLRQWISDGAKSQ